MNIFRINTTAYSEEDFFLLTDLTEEKIEKVITPVVMLERDDERYYTNEELVDDLILAYPSSFIRMYTEFETITI
jgi:hypothetical protein